MSWNPTALIPHDEARGREEVRVVRRRGQDDALIARQHSTEDLAFASEAAVDEGVRDAGARGAGANRDGLEAVRGEELFRRIPQGRGRCLAIGSSRTLAVCHGLFSLVRGSEPQVRDTFPDSVTSE